MGSWCEDVSETLKMGEKQDDEETWEIEGGCSSDRRVCSHSIDFHKGKLGKNSSDESEQEDEEDGKYTDGENERACRKDERWWRCNNRGNMTTSWQTRGQREGRHLQTGGGGLLRGQEAAAAQQEAL